MGSCPFDVLFYVWTWVNAHLLSSFVYGHGLMPICCPSFGGPGLIPSCCPLFDVVSEFNGHGLIPICCPLLYVDMG